MAALQKRGPEAASPRQKLARISRQLGLVVTHRLTPEERGRIPVDVGDVMDMCNVRHVWEWMGGRALRLQHPQVQELQCRVACLRCTKEHLEETCRPALFIGGREGASREGGITEEAAQAATVLFLQLKHARASIEELKGTLESQCNSSSNKEETMHIEFREAAAAGPPDWLQLLWAHYLCAWGEPEHRVKPEEVLAGMLEGVAMGLLSARQKEEVLGVVCAMFGMNKQQAVKAFGSYIRQHSSAMPPNMRCHISLR